MNIILSKHTSCVDDSRTHSASAAVPRAQKNPINETWRGRLQFSAHSCQYKIHGKTQRETERIPYTCSCNQNCSTTTPMTTGQNTGVLRAATRLSHQIARTHPRPTRGEWVCVCQSVNAFVVNAMLHSEKLFVFLSRLLLPLGRLTFVQASVSMCALVFNAVSYHTRQRKSNGKNDIRTEECVPLCRCSLRRRRRWPTHRCLYAHLINMNFGLLISLWKTRTKWENIRQLSCSKGQQTKWDGTGRGRGRETHAMHLGLFICASVPLPAANTKKKK